MTKYGFYSCPDMNLKISRDPTKILQGSFTIKISFSSLMQPFNLWFSLISYKPVQYISVSTLRSHLQKTKQKHNKILEKPIEQGTLKPPRSYR